MHIIREPSETCSIANPAIRQLIDTTMDSVSDGGKYDPDLMGSFIMLEQHDSLAAINEQLGWNILENRSSGIKYDLSGFTPAFELVQQHPGFFEILFILSDDGMGVTILAPSDVDIPELQAMCRQYAMPGE